MERKAGSPDNTHLIIRIPVDIDALAISLISGAVFYGGHYALRHFTGFSLLSQEASISFASGMTSASYVMNAFKSQIRESGNKIATRLVKYTSAPPEI